MSAECFNKLKSELNSEIEAAADKYIDRVENGVPIPKKGVEFHLGIFIKDTLLPKFLVV